VRSTWGANEGASAAKTAVAKNVPKQTAARYVKQNMNHSFAADRRTASNVPSAKRNWKWFQRAALLSLLTLSAGCSGIHASKSISPLDFILPGLMKHEPAPAPDKAPTPAAKTELPA
jgi:hypothetical protein